MTDQSTTDGADHGADRADALAAAVRDLKVPNQTSVFEKRLLWASIAAVVLGAILIFLGWLGASGHRDDWKILPYIVSGGIGGIALVTVGAVLFARWSLAGLFRFWLARTLTEQQQQTDRLIDAVEGLERAIRTNTAVTARIANNDAPAKKANPRLRSRTTAAKKK